MTLTSAAKGMNESGRSALRPGHKPRCGQDGDSAPRFPEAPQPKEPSAALTAPPPERAQSGCRAGRVSARYKDSAGLPPRRPPYSRPVGDAVPPRNRRYFQKLPAAAPTISDCTAGGRRPTHLRRGSRIHNAASINITPA